MGRLSNGTSSSTSTPWVCKQHDKQIIKAHPRYLPSKTYCDLLSLLETQTSGLTVSYCHPRQIQLQLSLYSIQRLNDYLIINTIKFKIKNLLSHKLEWTGMTEMTGIPPEWQEWTQRPHTNAVFFLSPVSTTSEQLTSEGRPAKSAKPEFYLDLRTEVLGRQRILHDTHGSQVGQYLLFLAVRTLNADHTHSS